MNRKGSRYWLVQWREREFLPKREDRSSCGRIRDRKVRQELNLSEKNFFDWNLLEIFIFYEEFV